MVCGRGRKGFDNIIILFVCISLPGRNNKEQLTERATEWSGEQSLQQEFRQRPVSGHHVGAAAAMLASVDECQRLPQPVAIPPLFVVLVD